MRLIDTSTRKLIQVVSPPPRYAILSHTWDGDEILFEDFPRDEPPAAAAKRKEKGYIKFVGAVELARSAGFEYVWIDNCCIDKSSSAELSEAINSMFRWYQKATVCYVYLSDYSMLGWTGEDFGHPVYFSVDQYPGISRWFRRSWTLQELIAPADVRFYSMEWHLIGTKDDSGFCRVLAERTRIPARVLSEPGAFRQASVAQRMSWAVDREATREEDCSYSLFGVLEVNMAPLYGEGGEHAFRRLQEEIIRTSSDDSILAWNARYHLQDPSRDRRWPALAPSLDCFRAAGNVAHFFSQWRTLVEHMSVTPWGVQMEVPVVDFRGTPHAVLSSGILGGTAPFGIPISHAGKPGQLPVGAQVYQRTSPQLRTIHIQQDALMKSPRIRLQLINDPGIFRDNGHIFEDNTAIPHLQLGRLDPRLTVMDRHPDVGWKSDGPYFQIDDTPPSLYQVAFLLTESSRRWLFATEQSVYVVVVSARPAGGGGEQPAGAQFLVSVVAYAARESVPKEAFLSEHGLMDWTALAAFGMRVPEEHHAPFYHDRESRASSSGHDVESRYAWQSPRLQADVVSEGHGGEVVYKLDIKKL